MIISVNWLKKYTEINLPIDQLTKLIGERLVEIEDVIDLGEKYKDVVVARVVECQKMENSDHLNVTKIDDGGVVQGIERDENGLIQVVCGAQNVAAGQLIAWLPPNTIVPETFGTAEPFVLSAKNLRGVMSNGMIASARELGLWDEHEGILVIDKSAAPGTSFAEVYELNDYLLDIENKSLTHRPDTFGVIGFAREVAAILSKPFTTPDWLRDLTPVIEVHDGTVPTPSVSIDDPALSDRYQAIVLSGASGDADSPLQIRTWLSRSGVRPISAVVDVTNYLMLLTGQPLHAFDYDKVLNVSGGKAEIHVRGGRQGEKLELLDGRTIELSPDDIVIAAGDTAIGLAGAMGGANTEIDGSTKNIILESATFNLYKLRGTQMRHGIFSEAITRFTKGQPPELTAPVLAEAVRLMSEWAGVRAVTPIVESYPGQRTLEPIEVSIDKVNETLGSRYMLSDVALTLQNVEFQVEAQEPVVRATPPYWRADIHIPEDLIEEVGRVSGFDTITPTLPSRDFTAVMPSDFDQLRARIRQILARAGANEVLTYSFVHGDLLKKVGQRPEDSFRIVNSISPDLQYYRQSLTPSLLSLVHPNIRTGFDEFALYELNKVHIKSSSLNGDVPAEFSSLALTLASKQDKNGAAYYQAKKFLDFLAEMLHVTFAYDSAHENLNIPEGTPFEYRRSAVVKDRNSGEVLGIVGEYKKSVARNFKLPDYAAGFEINTEQLLRAVSQTSAAYTPLSRYPSTDRDICFQVKSDVKYAQIVDAATEALQSSGLEFEISQVDIYQPENGETKNITIRIKLTSHQRTLTSDDVASVANKVIEKVTAVTGAVVI